MKEMIKLFKVIENSEFPKVDFFVQLADTLSKDSRVKVFNDGRSQLDRPLTAFGIGTGSKVVGVTSGAHADEPIGVLTQYYFIQGLLNNPQFDRLLKSYTFLCHPLVDPDGYELNSVWFTNPISFENYFLHNYRNNKPSEDCEHGIPFQANQAGRPEMLFVKKQLDAYRGQFEYYVTLHSSHILPGACFVFDRDHKDAILRNSIANLCNDYDVPLMDYKVQGEDTMTYLGKGFIGAPTITSMLDQYKNHPEILKDIKMTTYEYAQIHCGAKSAFISELPIWLAKDLADYSESTMTMNEHKRIGINNSKIYLKRLEVIDNELNQFSPSMKNPWYSSLKMALKRGSAQIKDEESKTGTYEGFVQQLEVMELASQLDEYECKALKYAIKSVEGISGAQNYKEQKISEFRIVFKSYQNKMNLQPLSVQTQVEIQLGLILSGLDESL